MTPCWQVMSSSFSRSISVFAAWRPLPTAVPKYLCRLHMHKPSRAQAILRVSSAWRQHWQLGGAPGLCRMAPPCTAADRCSDPLPPAAEPSPSACSSCEDPGELLFGMQLLRHWDGKGPDGGKRSDAKRSPDIPVQVEHMHEAGEAVCERLARYSAAIHAATSDTRLEPPRSLCRALPLAQALRRTFCIAEPLRRLCSPPAGRQQPLQPPPGGEQLSRHADVFGAMPQAMEL